MVALFPQWLYCEGSKVLDQARAARVETVIQLIGETIKQNLARRQCFLGRDPECLSPWGLYFAYHTCRHYICNNKESDREFDMVGQLKLGLATVDVRWNVAGRLQQACALEHTSNLISGVYLQLLEAQEAIRFQNQAALH